MALNINPINTSALAAYASNRIGNLGLPVPANTGLGQLGAGLGSMLSGLGKGMQARRAEERQNKLLAQEQANKDREFGLREKESESNLKYKEKLMGQLDTAAEKMAKEEDADKLNTKRAALAGVLSLSDEELEKYKPDYIAALQDADIINEEEANKYIAMEPGQLKTIAKAALYSTEKALSSKNISGSKGVAPLGGSQEEESKQNMPLSKTNVTRQQQEIADMMKSLETLEQAGKKYSDEYLTLAGRGQAMVGSWLSSLGMDNAWTQFTEDRSEFTSMLGRYFALYMKTMSGVQFGEKEMARREKDVINEKDNPAEFKGKLKSLLNEMKVHMEAKQSLIKEGIPLDSPEFQKKWDERVSSILNNVEKKNQEGKPTIQFRDSYKGSDGNYYSIQQIEAAAKRNNMSVQDVIDKIGGSK